MAIGAQLPAPAPALADARLDQASREQYARYGFAIMPGLVPPEELERLTRAYDELFLRRAGWDRGDFFDMLDPADRPDQALLPQLAWPSRHLPWLAETVMRARALEAATDLLGPGTELVWEFAIRKPPRIGAATPWHQDEASFTVGTPYRTSLSFWIPLQDVNEEAGCLSYVPGSHRGKLLPHASLGGDRPAHALAAVEPDLSEAVPVPLRAGDAVLHHSRVLHGAGPNLSGQPRRALTLCFAIPRRDEMMRRNFTWNRRPSTARDRRERAATPLLALLRQKVRLTLIRLGW